MMHTVKKVGRLMARAVRFLVMFAVLGLIWYCWPSSIVSLMDANLALIKWVLGYAPGEYGYHIEVVLRGLGADRALIFYEAGLLVELIWRAVVYAVRRAAH